MCEERRGTCRKPVSEDRVRTMKAYDPKKKRARQAGKARKAKKASGVRPKREKKEKTKKRRIAKPKAAPRKRRVVRKKAPPKKRAARKVVRKKALPKKRATRKLKAAPKKRRVVRKPKALPKKRKALRKPKPKPKVPPKKRRPVVRKPPKVPPRKPPVDRIRRERKRIKDLVEKARKRKQIRRRKRLPKRIPQSKRIDDGEQRLISVERVVTPENVFDIMHRIEGVVFGMSHAFQIWYASLELSTLGQKLIGYGQHVLNSDELDEDEEGNIFMPVAFDSTGVWTTEKGMMQALEDKLEDYASERTTVVLLHYVKVMNFDRAEG